MPPPLYHSISLSTALLLRYSDILKVLPQKDFLGDLSDPFTYGIPFLQHSSENFSKMASPFIIELLVRDHAPNYTIPTELCTLETCSITQAQLTYDPSLAGNVFFAALFALLLSIQIILGAYYRTWTFTIGLVGGLILEICGYIGRIQMHYNPFIQSPFFMYVPIFCLPSSPCTLI